MVFTSGTQALQGRTVNHDPEPWSDQDCWRWSDRKKRGYEKPGTTFIFHYDPRPEYAVLDNPILAGYRKHCETHRLDTDADHWLYAIAAFDAFGGYVEWDGTGHLFNVLATATPEQIDHAHRVLSRLAALAEVN